jgi:hypothetical protein
MGTETAWDPAQANGHAMEAILKASERKRVLASEDIYDSTGQKLWARGQPVSYALQQRLLERKLLQPIEACLHVEDGVTAHTLWEDVKALLVSDHPLLPALQPHASRLLDQIQQLPLHSVASLLLSAAKESQPELYQHAVLGMALAGAFALQARQGAYEVRMALLGGLLHDIGEMYINPEYLRSSQSMDLQAYKHVVVHPHVGAMLLEQLTDYPPALGRAIREHHERADGSGYPKRLVDEDISELGSLLAAVETILGVGARGEAPLARASLALRVIPGEYNQRWVDMLSRLAGSADELQRFEPQWEATELRSKMETLNHALHAAREKTTELVRVTKGAPQGVAAARTERLVQRLLLGWNACGLWWQEIREAERTAQFEIMCALREIEFRIRAVRRECAASAPDLDAPSAAPWVPLCAALDQALAGTR